MTGDPSSDARSLKQIDDRTLQLAVKQSSTVAIRRRIVVSVDGKTRTVSKPGIDPQGERFKSIAVYLKQ